MKYISIVGGNFALIKNDRVLGVVAPYGIEQWGFFPIVPGKTHGVTTCIPIHHALQEALKFEPDA